MGNFFCWACSKKEKNVYKTEKETLSFIEKQIYLPGTLGYLNTLGLNSQGKYKEEQSAEQRQLSSVIAFDLYAEKNLYLNHPDYLYTYCFPHSSPGGPMPQLINYNYFLRIFKTVSFWKRVRFEQTRPVLLAERRGFLLEKDEQKYKESCDALISSEREALDHSIKQVFEKIGIEPKIYWKSLKFYLQDPEDQVSSAETEDTKFEREVAEVRRQQLKIIQEYTSGHCCGVIKYHTGALEELDVQMSAEDALKVQDNLHKISILQIKRLQDLPTQDEVIEEYLYVKQKIEDYFYIQVGLEVDQFNSVVLRYNLEDDNDYKQMQLEYSQAAEVLYSSINLPEEVYLSELKDEDYKK